MGTGLVLQTFANFAKQKEHKAIFDYFLAKFDKFFSFSSPATFLTNFKPSIYSLTNSKVPVK